MEKELQPERDQEYYNGLADRLDKLQREKNGGRGISCIRGVVFELRRGKISDAKANVWNDHDKIRNYPDVVEILRNELFGPEEEDAPWNVLERMKKMRNKYQEK